MKLTFSKGFKIFDERDHPLHFETETFVLWFKNSRLILILLKLVSKFETDTETFGRWSQSWRLALRPPWSQSVSRPTSRSSLEKLLDCRGEGRRISFDCYESSKGRLCKNSREIMYVANYLTTEDDVRAIQPKPSIDFDFWKPLLTTVLIPPPPIDKYSLHKISPP